MNRVAILLIALVVTGCTSRIELPGTVIPAEAAPQARQVGPPVAWRPVDAETGRIDSVEGLQALAEVFPDSASVRLRMLGAALRGQDRAEVTSAAIWLKSRGYTLPAPARDGITMLFDSVEAEALLSDVALVAPVPASALVSSIGPEALLPESYLLDSANQREFVTTVVSRALFTRNGQETTWSKVPIPGAGSLAGLALDGARGLIWVASGVVGATPDPDHAFQGVIAVDRDTLAVVRRVAAPPGVSISDIGLGPSGSVYGSDPIGGGIYVAAPGASLMTVVVAPGTFRSPQGIAVRPHGRSFFVADYRYGLAEVTLGAAGQVYRVQTALPIAIDGIDGLWLRDNELIAIQNGLVPARIVAMRLGEGIANIAGYRVVERANQAWTEPLGGSVLDSGLYYVGNGSWDLYDEGGVLSAGAQQRPTELRRLELNEGPMPGSE